MNSTSLQYRSVNPATGSVDAIFELATDAEVDIALDLSDAAFRDWRESSIAERAVVVRRIGELFERDAEKLGRVASLEMGKSLTEAVGEVRFSASIFAYYADRAEQFLQDLPLETSTGDRAVIQKRPVGVLLGVMPWNYPYYQVARFIAPNLVAGNTTILKHAESVPACAAAIQELVDEAGAPQGAYVNLYATHEQVERIIADARVQGVSLTGSERAGSAVAALAGKYLKKCVLELGGSDPYVVLDADDIADRASQAWRTRTVNTGQACNSNKRMIVNADQVGEFVATLTERARAMVAQDPLEPVENGYSPLVTRAAAEGLAAVVQDAVDKGATLHAGGELGAEGTGYFSPAVLTGVDPSMRAFREELFGPVAVVYEAHTTEEALELANDSDYGLGGCVFSSDEGFALEVASRLDVGMANVNISAGEGPEIPFGGVKRSGYGRELGPLGIEEFVNKRLLYIK